MVALTIRPPPLDLSFAKCGVCLRSLLFNRRDQCPEVGQASPNFCVCYLDRRAQKGGSRRLIFLTRRGWKLIDCHRAAVLDLDKPWAKAIGQKRFDNSKKPLLSWLLSFLFCRQLADLHA